MAELVEHGQIDPEAWEADNREPAELRREMLTLPGVGPYVAENMLRFLGRPRGLGLDSWLRAKYFRMHHGGRRVTDRTIARRYRPFGPWAGLALWCEMTRDWFDGDGPSATWDSLN
jgi:3-methyladenine DNA glycosylase/8-oxoguanine DNA glycosylase